MAGQGLIVVAIVLCIIIASMYLAERVRRLHRPKFN
jgi:hypothetical protein